MSRLQPFRRTSSSIFWLLAAILVIAASPLRAGVGIWTPLGPDSASVYALAVHPANPRILYAGTETWGVFKSVDGGATWRSSNAGLGSGAPNVWIRALVIDPRDPATVYAASQNHGIFRSRDGGRSWAPASRGLPRAGAGFYGIDALILDPRRPRTLYASALGRVFRSTDGGGTWSPRQTGLPLNHTVNALALSPSTGILYAAKSNGQIFRSTDRGRTWQAAGSGLPRSVQALTLAVDPGRPQRLLAGTNSGLFRSTNSGRSWKPAGKSVLGQAVVRAVLFQTSRVAYAGTLWSGVFRSSDGGATWTPATEGITDPQILSLAAGHGAIFAGTSGYSRPGGVFRSLDSGATWEPIRRGLSTLLVQEVAVDSSDPDVLYAGTGHLGIFKSTDGGAHWSVLDLGIPPGVALDVHSMAIDPAQPSTIYAASRLHGPLLRSEDGGETWQIVGQPSFLIFEDLTVDPATPGVLWGATWGGLYRSEDEGETWERQPLPSTEIYSFQDVEVDPRDPQILYVSGATRSGAPLDPVTPLIFRSADGGQTWERRDTGIVENGPVTGLVLDPSDPSTLYASTFAGLYRSTDAGITWIPILKLRSRITAFAATFSTPPVLYVAKIGTGVLRSTNQGATWTLIRRDLGLHPVLVLRPDPHAPERIFAGTADGGIFTYTLPP